MTETTTSIKERRKAHAAKIGVDEEQIQAVRMDLEKIRTLGTLIDVDVHGISMFVRHASYDEWGIPKADIRALRLNRGSKNLIPHEYLGRLRSLEVRFRSSLDKHSFVLEGFRPYRWVPFTAYEEWKEEWDKLQGEWAEVKQDILDDYDSLRLQLRHDFIKIAAEAYEAIQARNGEMAEPWSIFVRRVARIALRQFPTGEQIKRDLWVDYKSALVLGAEDIEADLLARDRLREIRDEEAAKARLEQRKVQTEMAELREQEAERRRLREIRLKAEEDRLRAMHEAEMEHARRQMAETVSPWDELFQQLRAQMYQDAVSVLASIQRNGYLTGKVVQKAHNMVKTFRMLNAHDDVELEQKLNELRAALVAKAPNGADSKDVGRISNALSKLKSATAEAATEVKRRAEPSRWGALEI